MSPVCSYILNQLLTIKSSKTKLVTHFLTPIIFKNKIVLMAIINEPPLMDRTTLSEQLDIILSHGIPEIALYDLHTCILCK